MDPKALFNIGYGLYVITSNDGTRDNGMICNSVMQITSSPERVAVAINKANYSHDVIKASGIMNVNCISVDAPFAVFETFGFSSGRDKNKFEGCEPVRTENGLVRLPRYINSYISLKVEEYIDFGTHGFFVCSVTDSEVLTSVETMSYTYYHKSVKPKPKAPEKKEATQMYVCTVCGYVCDEDEYGQDGFECPLCHHPKSDFAPLA